MKKSAKSGQKSFGYIIAITHLYRIPMWNFDCIVDCDIDCILVFGLLFPVNCVLSVAKLFIEPCSIIYLVLFTPFW